MAEERISRIQVQYVDLPGFLHGVEVPYPGSPDRVRATMDGSSVAGFQNIEDSDLLLEGDADTFSPIPWLEGFARELAFVRKPSGDEYEKDPRTIALRVSRYVLGSYGYDIKVGVEVEFFLFNDVVLDLGIANTSLGYKLESIEYPWVAPSFGVVKKAYHAVEPVDKLITYRSRLAKIMDALGFPVEATHHEVALAQVEAEMIAGPPLYAADSVMTLKWAARRLAWEDSLVAVFLPKPVYGDNGSGMHLHVSLWIGDDNKFYEEGEGLSQLARYFIGGILEHAKSLAALVAATTNSYRRLVPGYEAPVYIAWGYRNRSAMIRVPAARSPDAARIEFRTPDPSSNPYLAITATIMAGIDGVRKKIDPGDPLQRNAYTLTEEERRRLGVDMLPKSLDEALDELESDNEYLKPVVPRDVIEAYIQLKRSEAEQVRMRPHPYEFYLYGSL